MKPDDQPLSPQQVEGFVKLLGLTRDREIACGEFLQNVSELAERQLASLPVGKALATVEHHILVCPECREEYEALMRVLRVGR